MDDFKTWVRRRSHGDGSGSADTTLGSGRGPMPSFSDYVRERAPELADKRLGDAMADEAKFVSVPQSWREELQRKREETTNGE